MFMRVTLRKRVPRNVGRVKPVRTAIRARRAFVDGSFQPATVVLDGGCIVDILGARERVDTEWRVLVPDDAVLLYNLACYFALSDQKEAALSWLGRALRMDRQLHRLIPMEPDFDSLRSDPDFRFIIKSVAATE